MLFIGFERTNFVNMITEYMSCLLKIPLRSSLVVFDFLHAQFLQNIYFLQYLHNKLQLIYFEYFRENPSHMCAWICVYVDQFVNVASLSLRILFIAKNSLKLWNKRISLIRLACFPHFFAAILRSRKIINGLQWSSWIFPHRLYGDEGRFKAR